MMRQDRLNQAKRYQKIRQNLALFHLVWTPFILYLGVQLPISLILRDSAYQMIRNSYGALALYFLIFSLMILIIDLPMAYYSGYILEQKFGLSNQTPRSWAWDFTKKSVLSFLFSLALILGLYALVWNFADRWWIIAWASYVFVSILMGKIFPLFIVPLFYQYSPVEDEVLRNRIFNLANRFQMPLQNIYSLNLSKTTKKANAAFMGLGKTKRVVLSDTLLGSFTHDEIEMVLAHELGHYKHKDIIKQLSLGTLLSFIAFWCAWRLMNPLASHFNIQGVSDIASLPLLFLIFYVVMLILTPLQNGASRMVERAADLFALKHYPEPAIFISCMQKLGEVNLSDPEPNPIYEWFFYDHPAIGKRIQLAERYLKGA